MRHCKSKNRLGRKTGHREATLAALVCALIRENRMTTTLSKAKAARRVAEKMVTLGKKDTVAARRHALAVLRQDDCVKLLFEQVSPRCRDRSGGYTRIVKTRRRSSDGSEMALLEWVDVGSADTASSDDAGE